MADKDIFKDIFSEKLKDIELPVSDKVWSAVSQQISTASVTSTGMSIVTKVIIGSTIAAVTVIGGIYLSNSTVKKPIKETTTTVEQEETLKSNQVKPTDSTETKQDVVKSSILPVTPLVRDTFMVSSNPPFIIEDEKSNEAFIISPYEKNVASTNPFEYSNKVKENLPNETKEIKSEEIKIIDKTSPEKLSETKSITLPNVFSPNNDGQNDYLFINTEEEFSEFSVVILDKNNQKMYQSNEPTFKWDGMGADGNLVPQGQYIYFITGKSKSGQVVNKYSSLFIQR